MTKKRRGGLSLHPISLNEHTRRMFTDEKLEELAEQGNELAKEELEVRKREREEFDK